MTRKSRGVAFAGAGVRVTWTHPQGARIADHLFAAVADEVVRRPAATFDIDADGDDFVVRRDGTLLYRGPELGFAALMVLDHSIEALASEIDGGLLLHAAAVAHRGRTLLIPGESGAGKTTLTAWLAANGFDYLSDELVHLPDVGETLNPFRRPLNIKRAARAGLEGVVAFDGSQALIETPEGYLIRQSAGTPNASAPTLLLFPAFEAGARLEITPLRSGRAALDLLRCLVNARRLPEGGLRQVSRLARTVPAFTLRYGHSDQLRHRIEALLDDSAD